MPSTRRHPDGQLPPSPRNGLPRVHAPSYDGRGAPAYDWAVVIPRLLDLISSGETVPSACRILQIADDGSLYRKLLSDQWASEYQAAREASSVARVERNTDRLEKLAEQDAPSKEQVNAARWAAAQAQWHAERADPARWGREDRLRVQSVSAVRVIVETPPVAAALPPVAATEYLPAEIETPRQLGAGGDGEIGGGASLPRA